MKMLKYLAIWFLGDIKISMMAENMLKNIPHSFKPTSSVDDQNVQVMKVDK